MSPYARRNADVPFWVGVILACMAAMFIYVCVTLLLWIFNTDVHLFPLIRWQWTCVWDYLSALPKRIL